MRAPATARPRSPALSVVLRRGLRGAGPPCVAQRRLLRSRASRRHAHPPPLAGRSAPLLRRGLRVHPVGSSRPSPGLQAHVTPDPRCYLDPALRTSRASAGPHAPVPDLTRQSPRTSRATSPRGPHAPVPDLTRQCRTSRASAGPHAPAPDLSASAHAPDLTRQCRTSRVSAGPHAPVRTSRARPHAPRTPDLTRQSTPDLTRQCRTSRASAGPRAPVPDLTRQCRTSRASAGPHAPRTHARTSRASAGPHAPVPDLTRQYRTSRASPGPHAPVRTSRATPDLKRSSLLPPPSAASPRPVSLPRARALRPHGRRGGRGCGSTSSAIPEARSR